MRPSLRVYFLIGTALAVLHVPGLVVAACLAGYWIFENLDLRLAKRKRTKAIEEIIFGWERSKDDSEFEVRGGLSRVKLTGQNQIIAARIGELLEKLL